MYLASLCRQNLEIKGSKLMQAKLGDKGTYLLWCFDLIPSTTDHIKSTLWEKKKKSTLNLFLNFNGFIKYSRRIKNVMSPNLLKVLFLIDSKLRKHGLEDLCAK